MNKGNIPIVVKNLSFSYNREGPAVLKDINVSVKKGEVLGVIGLSGCGKSTLCYCLSGIIPHNQMGIMEGDVLVFGQNTRQLTLPQIAKKIGIVFQDPETQLFLPRIINELAFGPENLCLPREEIEKIIKETVELTQIHHILHKNPNEISGGQKQIAALAAVLSLAPDILILDEATSQLDSYSCNRIQEIVKILKAKGKTIIMVEHHLNRLSLADRIMVLKEGRVLKIAETSRILNDKELLNKTFCAENVL